MAYEFIDPQHPLCKDEDLKMALLGVFIKKASDGGFEIHVKTEKQYDYVTSQRAFIMNALSAKNLSIFTNPALYAEHTEESQRKKKPVQKFPRGIAPSPEFTATKTLVSDSNKDAYNAIHKYLNKTLHGVLWLYGDSGCGKTHLLHYTANEAQRRSNLFYLNTVSGLMDQLKIHFTQKDLFSELYNDCDFFILDEGQLLNRSAAGSFTDAIFTIFNNLLLNQKTIIISSEHDISWHQYLPDRLLTRFKSGLMLEIQMPDAQMKTQFIRAYEESQGFTFPEIVMNELLQCPDLRTLKGCMLLATPGNQSVDKPIGGLLMALRRLKGAPVNTSYEKIYKILEDYYGVAALSQEKTAAGKRVPRPVANFRAVMYYLFRNSIPDLTLRTRLNIDSSHKNRTYEFGKKYFDDIREPVIKDEIRRLIMSDAQSEQADLLL